MLRHNSDSTKVNITNNQPEAYISTTPEVIDVDDNATTGEQNARVLEEFAKQETHCHIDKKIQQQEPPDGGWGWIVVIAGFVAISLAHITALCFGVLFSRTLMDMDAGSTTVAWIFNLGNFFFQISGMFGGGLVNAFGFRKTGVGAGFITALSMFLCAFANSPEILFFTYSLLQGIGTGISFMLPLLLLPLYFKKHLGRALDFVLMGISSSQVFGPVLVTYLEDQYGFRGAALILSAVFLHIVVASLLYHPVKWHPKKITKSHGPPLVESEQYLIDGTNNKDIVTNILTEHAKLQTDHLNNKANPMQTTTHDSKPKVQPSVSETFLAVIRNSFQNLRILKSPSVLIISLGEAMVFTGAYSFFMLLPFALQNNGHPHHVAAYSITVSAAVSMAGEILIGIIIEEPWFKPTFYFLLSNCIMIGAAIVIPWMTTQTSIMVMMTVWGFGFSFWSSLYYVIMIQYVGQDNAPRTLSASKLVYGLIYITVGPMIGMIRDATDSYTLAYYVIAGVLSINLVLWLFMPMARSYDYKRQTYYFNH